MIIITKIYSPIPESKQMVDSFERHGYEVGILTEPHTGHGNTLRELYACFKRAETAHEFLLYSDGADTYMQKTVEGLEEGIVYSAEKACYPHRELEAEYPESASPWKYLNGGGYCGPTKLLIEFFERYGLTRHPNDINGQHEQAVAFLAALKDGFPIRLDTECRIFQTTAFEDPGDFKVENGLVVNNLTGTTPCILHGNGRTPMDWIYDLHTDNDML